MTIIAWDGKTLAADKRATHCSYKGSSVTKIHTWEGGLCGFAGDMDTAVTLLAWLRAGAVPSEFPQIQCEDPSTLLVIYADGRVAEYGRTPFPMFLEGPFHAVGSGKSYALAAMHLGKNARKAVEVACALDSYCGNGIDTLTLKGAQRCRT